MLDLNSNFGRMVKRHLKNEYFIWLTTVDTKGTPQPRPVWFIWEDESFLVFSKANAYKIKHIRNNPNVSMHFNTKDEHGDQHVIVFTGDAFFDTMSPPAHEVPEYFKKYKTGFDNLKMTPQGFSNEYSVAIKIKPTEVRGWE